MKIALLAPFYYPLEEKSDGGIETFLYLLACSLVNNLHEVDVFTIDGSTTPGNKKVMYKEGTASVSKDPYIRQSREIAGSVKTFNYLKQHWQDYDVVHNNQISFYAHLQANQIPNCITTLHSPPDYYPILQAQDVNTAAQRERVVAISDFQVSAAKHLGFIGRVYNGINIANYQFKENAGDYLAWMGRFIPLKGVTDAITVAKETKIPLKLAGSKWDDSFFEEVMDSIEGEEIQFIGHADTQLKNSLLGNARAFIFPSKYEEFGYVRLEAMACGTPVICYDRGPAREIVIDGVTGFLCPPDDIEALKAAAKKIMEMPLSEYLTMRHACRQHVEKHFSLEIMTEGYEKIYRQIAAGAKDA